MMSNYYLNAMGLVSCLGGDKKAIAKVLFSNDQTSEKLSRYLTADNTMLHNGETCFLGRVQCLLPEIPEFFRQYNSRNNQMLLMTLLQIKSEIDNTIKQYGVGRVAVIIGTSTSGISDGEDALFHQKNNNDFPDDYQFTQQEICDGSEFIASYLRVKKYGRYDFYGLQFKRKNIPTCDWK